MFESLFGAQMPLPVLVLISFLIVLGLLGLTAGIAYRFQSRDRRARRWPKLPLLISLCAVALSLCALLALGITATLQNSSNRVVLSDSAADASRAVLYEEGPNDPQGKQSAGSTMWRTDNVAAAGKPPELVVVAEIDIPERRMGMTWTLRRDTDPSSPASHTIEIMFRLPQDFPSGGIFNVPGIWMKQAEQTQSTVLTGAAAKVTTGYFLIGLSAAPSDRERNIQMLRERPRLEIPMVYTNSRRAILAMQKGAAGERAFTAAFNAWKEVPAGMK
jgi:hypothetical protein